MKIKVSSLLNFTEYCTVAFLFGISLINNYLLLLALAGSLYYLFKGRNGLLKLLTIISIRYIVSPGIDQTTLQSVISVYKFALIFGFGTIVMMIFYKEILKNSLLIQFLLSTVFIMLIYLAFGIASSSQPILVIGKSFTYFYTLILIVTLLFINNKNKNFIDWLSAILSLVIMASLIFIRNSTGYLLNGFSFQGILNHPNLFGVFIALALSFLIFYIIKYKKRVYLIVVVIFIGLIELFLSNSRTAAIAFIASVIILFLFSKISLFKKLFVLIVSLGVTAVVFSIPTVNNYIIEFIQKGQSSNQILFSRASQINKLKIGMDQAPFLGSGFGVPINTGSLALDSYSFEAGNLIFGLLIYTGIVGTLVYLIYLLYIALIGFKGKNIALILFVATILVNMGELIMFSPNSMGIFCYILWGIYLREGMRNIDEQVSV